tara:strand:+ start:1403 stop:1597 length:195 start_codon:yes stop_codon:yes gene_type:complete
MKALRMEEGYAQLDELLKHTIFPVLEEDIVPMIVDEDEEDERVYELASQEVLRVLISRLQSKLK